MQVEKPKGLTVAQRVMISGSVDQWSDSEYIWGVELLAVTDKLEVRCEGGKKTQ